jgi:hypothetical protein
MPTGRLEMENVTFPPAPMVPVPNKVVETHANDGHE